MNNQNTTDFWATIDKLLAASEIVIDRPKVLSIHASTTFILLTTDI